MSYIHMSCTFVGMVHGIFYSLVLLLKVGLEMGFLNACLAIDTSFRHVYQ